MDALSLKEDKDKLMDEWTCQQGNEHNDRGDNAAVGQVTSTSYSLRAANNIPFTQPVTLARATPPVQSAVVTPSIDGQETVCFTNPRPFISTDRASIFTTVPQVAAISSRPPGRFVAAATLGTPQQTLHPTMQSRKSDGGLNISFTLPSANTSLPQLLSVRAAPHVDLSTRQGSSVSYSGSGANTGGRNCSRWTQPKVRPQIRLAPLSLPKFSGHRRNYWRWKAEWESIQAQGEPTGSQVWKRLRLLDSIHEAVKNELGLLHCRDANHIFSKLENRYGDKVQTLIDILLELQLQPNGMDQQPRDMLAVIAAVQRAALDLSHLGCNAVQNHVVIWSLESHLPDVTKREWLKYEASPDNSVHTGNRIDRLSLFLKDQTPVLERLEQLQEGKPWPANAFSYQAKPASEVKGESRQIPCTVCGDDKHGGKIFRCKTFKKANLSERKAQVKKAKACTKCLDVHGINGACTPKFLCRKVRCKKGDTPADHHYFLCPTAPTR